MGTRSGGIFWAPDPGLEQGCLGIGNFYSEFGMDPLYSELGIRYGLSLFGMRNSEWKNVGIRHSEQFLEGVDALFPKSIYGKPGLRMYARASRWLDFRRPQKHFFTILANKLFEFSNFCIAEIRILNAGIHASIRNSE
jgi:hypothetical protein